MPTYEYRCKSCDSRFDVWQKMSDDPLATCPTCGGPIRRVLFPAGIVFKGGGFYSTDHRANGSTPSDDAAPAEGKSGDAKPAAESKPTTDSTAPAESKSTVDSKPTAKA
jgi:putative FmdB family regulatory protein